MSETVTSHPPHWAPWSSLLTWAPFKIDALGLVTLLGAEEINASVGRLVRSRWLDYLPLLGAYVVAGNRFRQKESGFNLYNISQGIHTTDLAAWLTRWVKSQHFDGNRNFVRWTVVPPGHPYADDFIALGVSITLLGFLIALTFLQYDMYGLASSLSMALSVFVRWFLVRSIRQAIDEKVTEMSERKKRDDGAPLYPVKPEATYEARLKDWQAEKVIVSNGPSSNDPESGKVKAQEEPHRLTCGWNGSGLSKNLVITADAVTVTMMIPKELMGPGSVFNANIPPPHRFWYGVARWTGWIAFAVQVVTVGQADLVTQIYTVALLVGSTVLYVGRLGCSDSRWWHNIISAHRKSFFWLNSKMPWLNLKPLKENRKVPHSRFDPVSISRIGSRLVAEVYEWPLSHDFVEPEDQNPPNNKMRRRTAEDESPPWRGTRRMHLYAWLQLSEVERESMDKWDLFPHERENNRSWMKDYKHLRSLIDGITESGGSVRTIGEVEGAQDIMNQSTAATKQATASPDTLSLSGFYNSTANGNIALPGSDRQASSEVLEMSDLAHRTSHEQTAAHSSGVATYSPPPRSGTNVTHPSTAQASHTSHHSSSRRSSVPNLGSANWMTREVRQVQASRAEEEDQAGHE